MKQINLYKLQKIADFQKNIKDEISKLKMMDVNILDKQQIIKTRNLIRRWLGEIES